MSNILISCSSLTPESEPSRTVYRWRTLSPFERVATVISRYFCRTARSCSLEPTRWRVRPTGWLLLKLDLEEVSTGRVSEVLWWEFLIRTLLGQKHVSLGFHTGILAGGGKFVGHCHSVMHEYETIQIFKFVGGKFSPIAYYYVTSCHLSLPLPLPLPLLHRFNFSCTCTHTSERLRTCSALQYWRQPSGTSSGAARSNPGSRVADKRHQHSRLGFESRETFHAIGHRCPDGAVLVVHDLPDSEYFHHVHSRQSFPR